MTLAALFAKARNLESIPDSLETHQILAELRLALADGLRAHQGELRTFISLADRFGSHADVWNAARLLEERQELDTYTLGLRLSAWLHLFPDTARNSPEIALQLFPQRNADKLPDAILSGILSRWLESGLKITTRTNDPWTYGKTLLAAAKLAKTWWPMDKWVESAPGFASSFLDGAKVVSNQWIDNQSMSLVELNEVFAIALHISYTLQEYDDIADESEDLHTRHNEDKLPLSQTPKGGEQRIELISLLNKNRGKIWVVGGLRTKWQHLLGIAKTYGLEPGLFVHVGYDELKSRSIAKRVNPVGDLGIMLGPVPHSVVDLGGYSSLSTKLQQETSLVVIELRSQSMSQELKISKQSFRSGLDRMLDAIAIPFTAN